MNQTLILDLDGTLVDSVPDLLASCNRLMAARGLDGFSAREVAGMVGDGVAALVERVMAARGRVAAAADVDALLADYMAHPAEASRCYEGAGAALDELARMGWRFAVCTNKPVAAAHQVLAALGLSGRFAAVGGGDSYAVRKPDPGHLLATLAEAGGVAGAAVMLGDHHNDMAAARGAGVPAIFAAWGYGSAAMAGGAPVARGFAEVPGLAVSLLGG